jgi:hypothetical protein
MLAILAPPIRPLSICDYSARGEDDDAAAADADDDA